MQNIKNNPAALNLSAPWYTLQRALSYSIGQSRQVLVSELDETNYQITVTASNEEAATALADTLKSKQQVSDVNVSIVVKDISGNTYTPRQPLSIDEIIELLNRALANNSMVFNIEKYIGTDSEEKAAIVCTPTVIQFWNDNVSNPYGFTSMLAEDAFKQVFLDDIYVYTLGKKVANV